MTHFFMRTHFGYKTFYCVGHYLHGPLARNLFNWEEGSFGRNIYMAKRKTAVAILVPQFSYFNFHMNFSCKLSVYIYIYIYIYI